jgi:DNA-binding NarL/FixJ family response regulator
MKTQGLIHIFFLDDDRLFQAALERQVLEKLKFPVLLKKCQTVQQCLSCMGKMPDLFILDYNLGADETRTGMDVLDQIRKINQHVPVILLSSYVHKELMEKAIQHGANEVIEKNKLALQKTHDLIRDAIQSLLVYGGAEKYPMWRQNKPGEHQRLYLSLQPKSRTYFAPITLPAAGQNGDVQKRTKSKRRNPCSMHHPFRQHEAC